MAFVMKRRNGVWECLGSNGHSHQRIQYSSEGYSVIFTEDDWVTSDEYSEINSKRDVYTLFELIDQPAPTADLLEELVYRARGYMPSQNLYWVVPPQILGGSGQLLQKVTYDPQGKSFSTAFTYDGWDSCHRYDGLVEIIDLFRAFWKAGFPPPGDDQLDRLVKESK